MMLKYSLRVFNTNFSLVYKLAVYKIIVGLVCFALGFALLLPPLTPVLNDMTELGVFQIFEFTFENIKAFNIDTAAIYSNFTLAFSIAKDVLLMHASSLSLVYVLTGLLMFIWYFLSVFVDVPVGEVVGGSCTLQAKRLFTLSLVSRIKDAVKYSLVKLLIFLPFDLLIVGGSLAIFILKPLGIFSLTATFLFFFGMLALKLTLLSGWLPTLIEDKLGVFASFKKGLKYSKSRFGKILSTVFVLSILVYIFNVIVAILTFGALSFLALPASVVLFKCFYFVMYYGASARRYYADSETIVTPKSLQNLENNHFYYDLIEN